MKDRIKFVSKWMKTNQILIAALALCVALRILFVLLFPDWDNHELMDSTRYKLTAKHIMLNRGFVEQRYPSAFAPPLYPYFIAWVQTLFGANVIWIKIVQILLSAITGWVVYFIGLRLFNRSVGLIACVLFAMSPEIIVMAGSVYTETLYIFSSVLFLYWLLKAFLHPAADQFWVLAGLFLGSAILTRHILMALPFALIVFSVVFHSLRIYLKKLVLMSIVTLTLLLPWITRNYVVFDRFVPVASGVGGGLWHGSYLKHDGQYHYEETRQKLQEETRGIESKVDQDNALLEKAVTTIRDNPVQFAWVSVKKFVRFFSQVYEDIPQGKNRSKNILIDIGLMLSYYPIALFGLLGIGLSFKKWRLCLPFYLFIFYSAAIYALTLVTPRYRIPLLPCLILFASYGLYRFLSAVKTHYIHSRETV